MRGSSQAVLTAKQRAVKDLLPREVLEYTFLYLSREEIEALQLSHRYFRDIVSTESFGNLNELRALDTLHLLNDNLAICINCETHAKHFRYESKDVDRWLRNTCVNSFYVKNDPIWSEHALRWFIAHRHVFRVISIFVELPSVNATLQEAFLRPDPSHHWTYALFDGFLRGILPLTLSSLENVEHLDVRTPNLQVTVGDV
ncbi:hypothetical protein AAVH_21970, partial [Aphelenchoides avenae]